MPDNTKLEQRCPYCHQHELHDIGGYTDCYNCQQLIFDIELQRDANGQHPATGQPIDRRTNNDKTCTDTDTSPMTDIDKPPTLLTWPSAASWAKAIGFAGLVVAGGVVIAQWPSQTIATILVASAIFFLALAFE